MQLNITNTAIPQSEKTIIPKRVKRMYGLDLDWWKLIVFLCSAFAAAAAIGGVLSQSIVDKLQKQASVDADNELSKYKLDAGVKIAEANERAAEAKLELEKIKVAQAPWDFSDEKRAIFTNSLRSYPKGKILLAYTTADGTRSSDFADSLNRVLKTELGFDVWGYVGPFTSAGPAPLVGIQLSMNGSGAKGLRDALAKAFSEIGIDVNLRDTDGIASENEQAVISIGIKPKPK